jgi:hypothetical protein
VFWAHASNTARVEQSFRGIAEQVKVRGYKDPQADVFKLVHDWLRNKKNGRWLLVLDNVDDAGVLSPLTYPATVKQCQKTTTLLATPVAAAGTALSRTAYPDACLQAHTAQSLLLAEQGARRFKLWKTGTSY